MKGTDLYWNALTRTETYWHVLTCTEQAASTKTYWLALYWYCIETYSTFLKHAELYWLEAYWSDMSRIDLCWNILTPSVVKHTGLYGKMLTRTETYWHVLTYIWNVLRCTERERQRHEKKTQTWQQQNPKWIQKVSQTWTRANKQPKMTTTITKMTTRKTTMTTKWFPKLPVRLCADGWPFGKRTFSYVFLVFFCPSFLWSLLRWLEFTQGWCRFRFRGVEVQPACSSHKDW